jgi:hypothetical protein
MKELGLNRVNSLVHPGNKAFDPLRIVDRGLSVAKKSHDSVNVSSPKSRRSLVARAALRLDNMPNGDRKFGSLVSQKPFGEQSSLDEWRQTGSRLARDVRARASMGDAEETVSQELFRSIFLKLLDKYGYTKETNDPFIYDYVGGEEKQAHSLNFDSSVFDVPAEWRKAFLIARGQAFEEGRIAGVKIEQNPAQNDLHDITLFREASSEIHQVPKGRWPSIIVDMFKKHPDQRVMASTVISNRDYDSLFACMEVYQELEKLQGNKSIYKLEKGQLEQKERELQKLRNSQRKRELNYALFLQDLQKMQSTQFIIELQKDLSLQKTIDSIQNLRKMQDKISNIAIQEYEMIIKQYKSLFNQKKEELEQARNMQEVYDMMMGTPGFRSIVGKLPKEYIVDSIAIQKQSVTDSRTEALENEFDTPLGSLLERHRYEVCLSIKRVHNIDK